MSSKLNNRIRYYDLRCTDCGKFLYSQSIMMNLSDVEKAELVATLNKKGQYTMCCKKIIMTTYDIFENATIN